MLSCEYIARQSCAIVPRWRIFGEFLRPVFSASRVQHVSDLHPKYALGPYGHIMCGSMADIHSATAEIRPGKERRKKKPQDKNIMSASATQGGHNQRITDG